MWQNSESQCDKNPKLKMLDNWKSQNVLKMKNLQCGETQKLKMFKKKLKKHKMWQNPEYKCDKIPKLKLWQNWKSQNVRKKNQKILMWQNSETQNVIKLKTSKCHKKT